MLVETVARCNGGIPQSTNARKVVVAAGADMYPRLVIKPTASGGGRSRRLTRKMTVRFLAGLDGTRVGGILIKLKATRDLSVY